MYKPFNSVHDFVTTLHSAYKNNSCKEKETIHNRLMFTPLALAHKCLLILKEGTDTNMVYMNLANSVPSDKSKADYFMRYVYLVFYPERNQEYTPSMLNKFTNEVEQSITIENYNEFSKSLKSEYETEITQLKEIKSLYDATCKTEAEFVDMIPPQVLKV